MQARSMADPAREDRKACRDLGVTRVQRVTKGLPDQEDETGIRAQLVHAGNRAWRAYLVCPDREDQWDQKDRRDQRVSLEWACQDLRVHQVVCMPCRGTATSSLAAAASRTFLDQRAIKETGDLLDRRDRREEWAPRVSLGWTASPVRLDLKEIAVNRVSSITRNLKGKLSF